MIFYNSKVLKNPCFFFCFWDILEVFGGSGLEKIGPGTNPYNIFETANNFFTLVFVFFHFSIFYFVFDFEIGFDLRPPILLLSFSNLN